MKTKQESVVRGRGPGGEPGLDAILQAIRRCVGRESKEVSLHEPTLDGQEWRYVKECLDTGWVSSKGRFVDRFEERLSSYTGLEAVAVVNGTAGLVLALRLLGVRAEDEVIVPDLGFVAVPNAVRQAGAIPHFVDSSEESLGLDPQKLERWLEKIGETRGQELFNRMSGRRIRALVAIHVFGHPCDMDEIVRVARRFRLETIEDASEALGSLYRGRHVGHGGRVAVLSFNGNKIITTGGGGAVLSREENLAREAKHLSTTARVDHPWELRHDAMGYNFRLPNINAALGLAQMERLGRFLERKRTLACEYEKSFRDVPGVSFFTEPSYAKSNYWLNAILLDRDRTLVRERLLEFLCDHGIRARPVWTLMHRLPMYQDCPKSDTQTADDLERRIVNIPSSAFLCAETEGFQGDSGK